MIVHSMLVSPHEKSGFFRVVITSANSGLGLGRTHVEIIADASALRMFRNEIEKVVGPRPTHDLFGEKE